MSRNFEIVSLAIGVPLLIFSLSIAADRIPRARATSPQSVTNLVTCLAWLPQPMGAYEITDGTSVYYRVTDPAGRLFASGLAAYTFDAHGRFLGWTPDMGNCPTPGLDLSPTAKKETLMLDELRKNVR